MTLSSFLRYGFRDAFRSLVRHKGMVFVSVTTIAISLLILGSTLLLVLNSQYIVEGMESEIEINVFLQKDVDRQDALALKNKLEKLPGFESLKFVPKEEALAMMQERFGKETDLLKALGGNNPLPDTYRIKAISTEHVEKLAQEIAKFNEVESIRYGQDIVDKLISLTSWIRNIGMVVIIGMLVGSLFLITTTIRLTVFARKKEISIMKYVGATNGFIRFPFFLEGLFIGLLGSVLAGLAIYFGYSAVIDYVIMSVPFIPVMRDMETLYRILSILIGGGTLLGALGSILALRKYLQV